MYYTSEKYFILCLPEICSNPLNVSCPLTRVPISSFCFYILQSDIYFMSNVKANTEKPKRDKYTWLHALML